MGDDKDDGNLRHKASLPGDKNLDIQEPDLLEDASELERLEQEKITQQKMEIEEKKRLGGARVKSKIDEPAKATGAVERQEIKGSDRQKIVSEHELVSEEHPDLKADARQADPLKKQPAVKPGREELSSPSEVNLKTDQKPEQVEGSKLDSDRVNDENVQKNEERDQSSRPGQEKKRERNSQPRMPAGQPPRPSIVSQLYSRPSLAKGFKPEEINLGNQELKILPDVSQESPKEKEKGHVSDLQKGRTPEQENTFVPKKVSVSLAQKLALEKARAAKQKSLAKVLFQRTVPYKQRVIDIDRTPDTAKPIDKETGPRESQSFRLTDKVIEHNVAPVREKHALDHSPSLEVKPSAQHPGMKEPRVDLRSPGKPRPNGVREEKVQEPIRDKLAQVTPEIKKDQIQPERSPIYSKELVQESVKTIDKPGRSSTDYGSRTGKPKAQAGFSDKVSEPEKKSVLRQPEDPQPRVFDSPEPDKPYGRFEHAGELAAFEPGDPLRKYIKDRFGREPSEVFKPVWKDRPELSKVFSQDDRGKERPVDFIAHRDREEDPDRVIERFDKLRSLAQAASGPHGKGDGDDPRGKNDFVEFDLNLPVKVAEELAKLEKIEPETMLYLIEKYRPEHLALRPARVGDDSPRCRVEPVHGKSQKHQADELARKERAKRDISRIMYVHEHHHWHWTFYFQKLSFGYPKRDYEHFWMLYKTFHSYDMTRSRKIVTKDEHTKVVLKVEHLPIERQGFSRWER